VNDTGEGMSKEVQARAFEPFFTTKGSGKGTGLGLSTVFGIVKQSGGSVWVYSEPGHGTAFKVYLPRVDAREEALEKDGGAPEGAAGRETVLLVEDDDVVREVTASTLEELGYVVVAAANGEEALGAAKAREGPLHLLVTDVIMPGMGGGELSRRLRQERPGIKVLHVSGYTAGALQHSDALEDGAAFLPKPFTPKALIARLHEVMRRGEVRG
jgi:CheY-like chemotaxis protein